MPVKHVVLLAEATRGYDIACLGDQRLERDCGQYLLGIVHGDPVLILSSRRALALALDRASKRSQWLSRRSTSRRSGWT